MIECCCCCFFKEYQLEISFLQNFVEVGMGAIFLQGAEGRLLGGEIGR